MSIPEELRRKLEAAGVKGDLLGEVEKGYLRQDDYTRKRQHESETVRQLQQQVAALEARNRPVEADPLDAALSHFDKIEGGDEAKKIFMNFAAAMEKKYDAKLQGPLSQVVQSSREAQFDRKLEEYRTGPMREKFGDDVDKYWPQIKDVAMERLLRNERVVPEDIFYEVDGDQALELRSRTLAEKKKQTEGERLSGFERVRRDRPSLDAGEDGGLGGERGGDSVEDIAADVMAELGL